MNRTLAVLALVVLAGCTAPAPAAETTVSVSVSNDTPATYEVRIAAVSGDVSAVDLTYANGTTTRVRVSRLSGLGGRNLSRVVDMVPVGENVTTNRYRLEPNTGIGDRFAGLPRGTSVTYLVVRAGATRPMRGWGELTCRDSRFTNVSVAIERDGRLGATTACSGP